MRQKISNVFYVLVSILLLGCYIYLLISTRKLAYIALLVMGIILFPICLNRLLKFFRISDKVHDIVHGVIKGVLPFWGIILVMKVSLNVYEQINLVADNNFQLDCFKALLGSAVYVVYLFFTFMFVDIKTEKAYIVFGFFYILCTILRIVSTEITDLNIAEFLFDSNANDICDAYIVFRDACLESIKEAILTFIIFDTAVALKEKKEVKIDKGNNKVKVKKTKTKVEGIGIIKNIWYMEKERLSLTIYKILVYTLLCLIVFPFVRENFKLVWWCVICGVIVFVSVFVDYRQKIKLGKSLWELVIEKCRQGDGYKRFIAVRDCIKTYKSDSVEYADDKSRILNNIYVLEATLAQDKAFIVVLPIVITAFAWFVGSESISFEKLVFAIKEGSFDGIIIFALVVAVFVSLKTVVKQYPENAFIKKVIESIREELKEEKDKEKR